MPAQTTYSDSQPIGYTGSLDYKYPNASLTLKNVEASAAIDFGKGVKFKTAAPVSDLDALLPAAQADAVVGLVVRSDTYSRAWTDEAGNAIGQLSASGLVPGTLMQVARKGRMLVVAATAVKPGDPLHVRCVAGSGKFPGDLENVADGINTVNCSTQGRWVSTASIGGLAWLEFDFTNI
jgi:hypothetical protein